MLSHVVTLYFHFCMLLHNMSIILICSLTERHKTVSQVLTVMNKAALHAVDAINTCTLQSLKKKFWIPELLTKEHKI